jgi:hypothetical protein
MALKGMILTLVVSWASLSWASPHEGSWVKVPDPEKVHQDLPPAGSSLFDKLFSKKQSSGEVIYNFPEGAFKELVESLRQKLVDPDGLEGLILPLGRSLQRHHSLEKEGKSTKIGDLPLAEKKAFQELGGWSVLDLFRHPLLNKYIVPFFQYPRVVVAFNSNFAEQEGDDLSELIKKRLYLGYHNHSKILEVVSYNREAARFEFQIVRDFQKGGKKQAFYANRALCTTCHQNQGPIFSRRLWKETNANQPLIQNLLETHLVDKDPLVDPLNPTYFGVPIRVGADTAQSFDTNTDESNDISLYQKLWREGCASLACRALAFEYMLRYRLQNKKRHFVELDSFRQEFVPIMKTEWEMAGWMPGLVRFGPDIAFRDPFTSRDLGLQPSELNLSVAEFINFIPFDFEPASERPLYFPGSEKDELNFLSLDPHSFEKELETQEMILGLADEFLTEQDVKNLDQALVELSAEQKISTWNLGHCYIDQVGQEIYDCEKSQAEFLQSFWQLKPLSEGNEASVFAVSTSTGLPLRTPQGYLVRRLVAQWDTEEELAKIELEVVDDMAWLISATKKMAEENHPAFAAANFQRPLMLQGLYQALSLSAPSMTSPETPTPVVDKDISPIEFDVLGGNTAELRLFKNACIKCHSRENSKTTFMRAQTAEELVDNLDECAPRIYMRLRMWEYDRSQLTDQQKKAYRRPMPAGASAEKAQELVSPMIRYIKSLLLSSEREANQSLIQQGFLEQNPLQYDYDQLPHCP